MCIRRDYVDAKIASYAKRIHNILLFFIKRKDVKIAL